MKKLPLILMFVFFLSETCAFSTSLNDLTKEKPLMGRLGIGNKLENNEYTLSPKTSEVEAKNKYSEIEKAMVKPSEKTVANKPEKTITTPLEKTIADPSVKNKLLPVIPNKTTIKEEEIAQKQEENLEKKEENVSETDIENNTENTENENTENTIAQANVSYADLSLKKIAQDVSYELDLDETKTASDLAILWAAATERSETMKYTIYKLSNPDEDKPNESTIKKILKPIANFSTLAGASVAGDPFMATGALIGGGLVNAFMKDDKEYNYKFSKVSDADMVLLVRKIDELQKRLLDLYTDYKTKEQLVLMTKENFEKREEIYNASQKKSKEELIIADVYYKNAKTSLQRAQDDYLTSRAILENLVGAKALKEIEKE